MRVTPCPALSAADCRYYEDASDEFREGAGTLLPLWKFSYEPTKKFHVTNICWNPRYHDMFAVTLGYRELALQRGPAMENI